MVRNYQRKTNRQEWLVEKMQQAVEAVIKGEMGLRKASVQFHVPKTSLYRYIQKNKQIKTIKIDKTEGKFGRVFTEEQEVELVDYLKEMESRLCGLTMRVFRSVAFQLAEKNKIKHSFNKESKMAGDDWMKSFLARHPELRVRKPEATSDAKAQGLNQADVTKFFTLLIQEMEKHKPTPDDIFDCNVPGTLLNPKDQITSSQTVH